MIHYELYRAFYYVGKYRSFTHAAAALLTSQPNVTRAIKGLEAALGCTLFLRSNRGVSLTPEGEALFNHVSAAVEQLQAGEDLILRERSLESGTITIAASEIALRCLLLPFMRRFRRRYPAVHIRIQNRSGPQAIQTLSAGFADFALIATPLSPPDGMESMELCKFHDVPVCSPEYTSLTNRTLTLAELTAQPIVSLARQTQSYAFYAALFAQHGLSFEPDVEVATADQILPLVESGLGIGFVPEQFLRGSDRSRIQILSLETEIPERSIVLLRAKSRTLSIAARTFCQLLTEPAGQF